MKKSIDTVHTTREIPEWLSVIELQQTTLQEAYPQQLKENIIQV